eukprot:TRINITY_DN21701_c0_g1_i4.p1 TRINITY_DN21701_c0_g1~~TRINITY_DN21701_c0_g1_i4.p1  ORF type:complete len:653 (-),score=134.33 TRINITY_DN21701_c0_g1_i4:510-2468(-)
MAAACPLVEGASSRLGFWDGLQAQAHATSNREPPPPGDDDGDSEATTVASSSLASLASHFSDARPAVASAALCPPGALYRCEEIGRFVPSSKLRHTWTLCLGSLWGAGGHVQATTSTSLLELLQSRVSGRKRILLEGREVFKSKGRSLSWCCFHPALRIQLSLRSEGNGFRLLIGNNSRTLTKTGSIAKLDSVSTVAPVSEASPAPSPRLLRLEDVDPSLLEPESDRWQRCWPAVLEDADSPQKAAAATHDDLVDTKPNLLGPSDGEMSVKLPGQLHESPAAGGAVVAGPCQGLLLAQLAKRDAEIASLKQQLASLPEQAPDAVHAGAVTASARGNGGGGLLEELLQEALSAGSRRGAQIRNSSSMPSFPIIVEELDVTRPHVPPLAAGMPSPASPALYGVAHREGRRGGRAHLVAEVPKPSAAAGCLPTPRGQAPADGPFQANLCIRRTASDEAMALGLCYGRQRALSADPAGLARVGPHLEAGPSKPHRSVSMEPLPPAFSSQFAGGGGVPGVHVLVATPRRSATPQLRTAIPGSGPPSARRPAMLPLTSRGGVAAVSPLPAQRSGSMPPLVAVPELHYRWHAPVARQSAPPASFAAFGAVGGDVAPKKVWLMPKPVRYFGWQQQSQQSPMLSQRPQLHQQMYSSVVPAG